jgi:hypothetical protein
LYHCAEFFWECHCAEFEATYLPLLLTWHATSSLQRGSGTWKVKMPLPYPYSPLSSIIDIWDPHVRVIFTLLPPCRTMFVSSSPSMFRYHRRLLGDAVVTRISTEPNRNQDIGTRRQTVARGAPWREPGAGRPHRPQSAPPGRRRCVGISPDSRIRARRHLPPPDGRHEVEEKGWSTMLEEDAPRRAALTGKSRSRSSLRRLDLARREASPYLLVGVAARVGPSSSDARGGHDKLIGSSSLPRSSLPFVLLLCSSIAKGKRRRWGGRRPPPLQPVHGGAGARDGPGAVQCDRTTLK